MTEFIEESENSVRVYEAGYLLLPSISEEKVSDEVSLIKSTIEKHGGVFKGEVSPRHIPLAYEIVKHIGARNERFNSAYFGAIQFKAESTEIPALTKALEANPSIVRFLLIKADKELKKPVSKREVKEEAAPLDGEETLPLPNFSQEDIDKSIEELVAE
jgi:ribosomal protein S6